MTLKAYEASGEHMVKIVIDYAKCGKGDDKICVEVCPVSVFSSYKSEKPKVANEESCTMCRTCEVNCPSQAIRILA